MKSLWKDSEARKFRNNPLAMRVYTSRLLGQNPDLVLHGGGNTSVKAEAKNSFGKTERVLFVKGSGWDLATIEPEGFPAVNLDALKRMAAYKTMTDSQMVKMQRSVMLDPYAPNPSVEAILHAIIPYTFVDHTHADAVVTITNSPQGRKKIESIYGSKVLIVPYIMPGFILARRVYEMTQLLNWDKVDAIILMNHGVFTFDDDAKKSYEKMIRIVTKAEQYIKKHSRKKLIPSTSIKEPDLLKLAEIRKSVSKKRGGAVIVKWLNDKNAVQFSKRKNIKSLISRGPLTPDHVIRTKRIGVLLNSQPEKEINQFADRYGEYFDKYKSRGLSRLDSAPRWGVWAKNGILCFDKGVKEVNIISDIIEHTVLSICRAENLDGWRALGAKEIFDVEYWELEQAKLRKQADSLPLQGKIAIVTGAASGIGRACVEELVRQGVVVGALDIDKNIVSMFDSKQVLGIACDLVDKVQVKAALHKVVSAFGGLDILISNAGTFPKSQGLDKINCPIWAESLNINLSAHQRLLKYCIPYLKRGIDPSVVIMASKNVPAPGPGAASYSVAKAGLTQLARIAALELGEHDINVNILHPNQIFDTAIWTDEVLKNRARHYGITVSEYKTNNILHTEITSNDVAKMACAMAGPLFAKSTGNQITIDGGNDRVI